MDLKKILAGKKDVFGLDIGSSYIKAVQLQLTETGYKVIAANRVEIAFDSSSKRAETAKLIKTINNCVKSARIKTKYAVCGVCGPSVASRPFNFTSLQNQDIDNAVLREVEQVCPFDYGKFIVDYQLIDNNDGNPEKAADSEQNNNTQGVLVAATNDLIARKNKLARAAYFNCVLMDVDGLALLNCFLQCEENKEGQTTAILDVGSKFTNLSILNKNGPPFVRDVAHAGDEIISKIADEHKLSPQELQEVLSGTQDKKQNIGKFTDSLPQACTKLISDIMETLRYHMAQEGSGVDNIFVCGGFAQTEGFIELLDYRLPSKVVLWNPFKKMRYDSQTSGFEIIEKHGPSLALAAGLAMRTI